MPSLEGNIEFRRFHGREKIISFICCILGIIIKDMWVNKKIYEKRTIVNNKKS